MCHKHKYLEDYEEHVLYEVKEHALKTLEYINDHLGRDNEKAFTSQQCDDVLDCVHMLKHIHQIFDEDDEDETVENKDDRRR